MLNMEHVVCTLIKSGDGVRNQVGMCVCVHERERGVYKS